MVASSAAGLFSIAAVPELHAFNAPARELRAHAARCILLGLSREAPLQAHAQALGVQVSVARERAAMAQLLRQARRRAHSDRASAAGARGTPRSKKDR